MIAPLLPFLILAALGFAISLVAHLLALAGVGLPSNEARVALLIGIFVVLAPTMLISWKFNPGRRLHLSWKQMLSGCPDWMRYAAYGLFAYAVLNFFLMMGKLPPRNGISPASVRLFSSYCMLFYGLSFCTLYTFYRKPPQLSAIQCPNGHPIAPSDHFCPICGKTIPTVSA